MKTLQKSSKTWRAQIHRKGCPPVPRSFDAKTYAQVWACEVERDSRSYIDCNEAESTALKQALRRYLKEITPTKKGAKQEVDRIKVWMERLLAQYTITNIHGKDLAIYRYQCSAEGKSSSTVRNEINIIGRLFYFSKNEWGMAYLVNPVQNLRMPKQPAGRERRLRDGEAQALLDAYEYPLNKMIVLALETDMHFDESPSINWPNIDVNKGIAVLKDTNNGGQRSVSTSTEVSVILKHLPRYISKRLSPEVTNYDIFHNFRQSYISLNIKNLRFHDLRHDVTSRLV